jgi:hypothetical protein
VGRRKWVSWTATVLTTFPRALVEIDNLVDPKSTVREIRITGTSLTLAATCDSILVVATVVVDTQWSGPATIPVRCRFVLDDLVQLLQGSRCVFLAHLPKVTLLDLPRRTHMPLLVITRLELTRVALTRLRPWFLAFCYTHLKHQFRSLVICSLYLHDANSYIKYFRNQSSFRNHHVGVVT